MCERRTGEALLKHSGHGKTQCTSSILRRLPSWTHTPRHECDKAQPPQHSAGMGSSLGPPKQDKLTRICLAWIVLNLTHAQVVD
jgi:hypothetical protein